MSETPDTFRDRTAEQRVTAYLDALESWMWTWRTAGPVAWIMSGEDQLDLEAADLRAVLAENASPRAENEALRNRPARGYPAGDPGVCKNDGCTNETVTDTDTGKPFRICEHCYIAAEMPYLLEGHCQKCEHRMSIHVDGECCWADCGCGSPSQSQTTTEGAQPE